MAKRIKLNLIDYFIGVSLIFIFSWNPNFAHGYITGLDEGVHLPWINQILLGGIPYKQIYIVWGPFSEWLPALFMKIAGVSVANFRLFYHLSRLFTLILGFFVLKELLKTRLFGYLGVWLLVATKVSDFWSSRWGSTRLLFGLLAILLFILYIEKSKKYFLFLSGMSSGLALFNSQESGVFCILAILLTLFVYRRYLVDTPAKILSRYLLGCITIALPVCIYFLLNAAFLDFIKINFIDTVTVYPKVLLQTRFSLSILKVLYLNPNSYLAIRVFYFLVCSVIFFIGFGYLSFTFMSKKIGRAEINLCLIIIFGALFLLSATRQITGEQLPYCAPMVIIVALFLSEKLFIWSKDKKIFLNAGVSVCIILSLFYFFIKSDSLGLIKGTVERYASITKSPKERFHHFIYIPSHPVERYARLTGRWKMLDIERARGVYVPEEQAKVITEVVNFIRGNTSLNEPILVFPHEGQYYFLTNRPSPTRIVPLIYAALRPEYQKEVIMDLEKNRPRYCIYIQNAQIVPRANGNIPNELLLNLIYKYMIENYRVVRQYGRTFILTRK